jgi:hypothetical protein
MGEVPPHALLVSDFFALFSIISVLPVLFSRKGPCFPKSLFLLLLHKCREACKEKNTCKNIGNNPCFDECTLLVRTIRKVLQPSARSVDNSQ